MKNTIIAFVIFIGLNACTNYSGIPSKYHSLLDKAITKSKDNEAEIRKALNSAPAHHKEAVAYLIAYMPEMDLQTLTADFILENTDYAYMAKERFSWTQQLPDSIFFNEILPYASLNERRDNWRKDFFERFSKYVSECNDLTSAIDSLNKNIRDELLVDYNTKREKPDQSPYESMNQKMASCSGLSILLTDAFRAVGIPSRVAGTANWHDKRGNHNWNEVWIDGQWFFTEYYPSGLNKSWFLADAGKATTDNPDHAIYASSWKPSDATFPLVWDLDIKYVPAQNVTERYITIYKEAEKAKKVADTHVIVKIIMLKDRQCSVMSDDRVAVNVDVFCEGEQISGGRTAGATHDLNNILEFQLQKNKDYHFNYTNKVGQPQSIELKVKGEPISLQLYYNN